MSSLLVLVPVGLVLGVLGYIGSIVCLINRAALGPFMRARRTRPGECRTCRYTLAGLPLASACPECGDIAPRTRAAHDWDPRSVLAALGVVLLEMVVSIAATVAACGLVEASIVWAFAFGPAIVGHAVLVTIASVRTRVVPMLLFALLPAAGLLTAGILLVEDCFVWHPDAQAGITLAAGGLVAVPGAMGLGAGAALLITAGIERLLGLRSWRAKAR